MKEKERIVGEKDKKRRKEKERRGERELLRCSDKKKVSKNHRTIFLPSFSASEIFDFLKS